MCLQDDVLNIHWISSVSDDKVMTLAGGMDMNGAVFKERGHDAIDGDRDILELLDATCGDFAIKESFLIDIKDALVRYNPDVEIIVSPLIEKRHPDDDEPEREEESKHDCTDVALSHFVDAQDDERRDEQWDEKERDQDEDARIKNNHVPADLHEHGLAGFECDEFGDVVFVFHEKLEREDKCRGTREQQKPTDEIGELHTFYSRVSGAVAVPVVQKNRAHHDPHNEHETPEDPQNVGGESYFSNGSKVEIHENSVSSKSEIRSTKPETSPKSEIQMFETNSV
ncbi:MAG: hypothetical protein RLY47_289 [Candidatus Parcubacteria bacterium]